MLLKLPASVHCPITVTELLKQPNDEVEKFAPLFSYSYKTTVTEGDGLGNERQVERSFPAEHKAEIDGILRSWKIRKGDVIERTGVPIIEIDEPCSHSMQFGGMCAICGKDMTETSYNTEQRDSARATVNMVHDNVELKVSDTEARRVEDEAKRRLLSAKKLSLVVDLDQTIIHATVDPTVGDWQRDENNPNHEAVKDVKAFLLKDDGPGNRGCWYYVKMRPGLQQFLENVSKIYELHIYTMGTRQYAKNIADIIDPQHRIFGDRILSRDESGSMTAKSLQRLFPFDTKMVVIIDDRGDVWKWSPNLIKVIPYDFFVGIGDINSSFLPKKPNIKPLPKMEPSAASDAANVQTEGPPEAEPGPPANGLSPSDKQIAPEDDIEPLVDESASPLQQLVAMGGGDHVSRSAQSTQQTEAIAAQLEERPLLQKQKKLEADEAVASADAVPKEGLADDNEAESRNSCESDKPKQNLLRDNDRELYQLEISLKMVHSAFFEAYYQRQASAQGGRLGQLRGTKKQKLTPETSDLDLVPDIKNVMPAVKSKVLGDTVIVFSGIVPLGMDVGSTDLAIQSASFGARIEEEVTKNTTHLAAARNRTQKVRTAMRKRRGRIKIVSPEWLYHSISSWSRKDEAPYLLDVEEGKNGEVDEEEDNWSESESLAGDESEDTDTTDADKQQASGKPTKLTIKPPRSDAGDKGPNTDGGGIVDFEYDEKSPVGGSNEDWSAMNDELKDFLGSEAEDSDDDNASQGSNTSVSFVIHGKKRNREDYESGGEDGDEGAIEKKTLKKTNATSLSQTTHVDDHHDEPGVIEEEEKVEGEEEPAQEGDGWSDFDDEDFEAELEKALSEPSTSTNTSPT